MPTIMADHDTVGHLRVLMRIWSTPEFSEIWVATGCGIESFEHLGLASNTPDSTVWKLCQERGIVLLTGNRNSEGEDSLEQTIRRESTSNSLPVFTISDPTRLMKDSQYARQVAVRIHDYLQVLDRLKGAGRMYLP
jgi:hypothetical protein